MILFQRYVFHTSTSSVIMCKHTADSFRVILVLQNVQEIDFRYWKDLEEVWNFACSNLCKPWLLVNDFNKVFFLSPHFFFHCACVCVNMFVCVPACTCFLYDQVEKSTDFCNFRLDKMQPPNFPTSKVFVLYLK
eukprot:TRINITY_DN15709_c0_g1_i13.p1 TRINITY_DN15709_c0_g1~~TRINITY_DN15709_c0_g1_i13.p1  ORF type:complete len:134 (-),score=8.85 TRINITY_DN15709_c0_g1_i13:656-1057(-)